MNPILKPVIRPTLFRRSTIMHNDEEIGCG